MADHKKNTLDFVLLSDIQSFTVVEPENKPFNGTIRSK